MEEAGFKCSSIVGRCALCLFMPKLWVSEKSRHALCLLKRLPQRHVTCLSGSVARQVLEQTCFTFLFFIFLLLLNTRLMLMHLATTFASSGRKRVHWALCLPGEDSSSWFIDLENKGYPPTPSLPHPQPPMLSRTRRQRRPWDVGGSGDVWCWIFPLNGRRAEAAMLGGRELCGRLRTCVFPSQRASEE